MNLATDLRLKVFLGTLTMLSMWLLHGPPWATFTTILLLVALINIERRI